jgi:hypothetical protein
VRLISNSGTDRVPDVLQRATQPGAFPDTACPTLSLFAFLEPGDMLKNTVRSRLILPLDTDGDLGFMGSPADRAGPNRLQSCRPARECAKDL